jgi:hypothetical protein
LAWEIINEPEQLFPKEKNAKLNQVPMWQVGHVTPTSPPSLTTPLFLL